MDGYKVYTDGIVAVFEARFKFSYYKVMSLAYLLDPIYWSKNALGQYSPRVGELTHEQTDGAADITKRLAGASEQELSEVMRELSDFQLIARVKERTSTALWTTKWLLPLLIQY